MRHSFWKIPSTTCSNSNTTRTSRRSSASTRSRRSETRKPSAILSLAPPFIPPPLRGRVRVGGVLSLPAERSNLPYPRPRRERVRVRGNLDRKSSALSFALSVQFADSGNELRGYPHKCLCFVFLGSFVLRDRIIRGLLLIVRQH